MRTLIICKVCSIITRRNSPACGQRSATFNGQSSWTLISLPHTAVWPTHLPCSAAATEPFPKARAAALQAINIDGQLAEGHAALGFVKHYYDWDWSDAEQEFKRALALNPSYSAAHSGYGRLLMSLKRNDEGIREMERAVQLDPISPVARSLLGIMLVMARKYGRAIEVLQKTLELGPHLQTYSYLGLAYTEKSMLDEAIESFQRADTIQSGMALNLAGLGRAYALAGRTKKALQTSRELSRLSTKQYVSPVCFAMIQIGLGRMDEAFDALNRAFEERSFHLVYLNVNPMFDSLRRSSRVATLAKRVGLCC